MTGWMRPVRTSDNKHKLWLLSVTLMDLSQIVKCIQTFRRSPPCWRGVSPINYFVVGLWLYWAARERETELERGCMTPKQNATNMCTDDLMWTLILVILPSIAPTIILLSTVFLRLLCCWYCSVYLCFWMQYFSFLYCF